MSCFGLHAHQYAHDTLLPNSDSTVFALSTCDRDRNKDEDELKLMLRGREKYLDKLAGIISTPFKQWTCYICP